MKTTEYLLRRAAQNLRSASSNINEEEKTALSRAAKLHNQENIPISFARQLARVNAANWDSFLELFLTHKIEKDIAQEIATYSREKQDLIVLLKQNNQLNNEDIEIIITKSAEEQDQILNTLHTKRIRSISLAEKLQSISRSNNSVTHLSFGDSLGDNEIIAISEALEDIKCCIELLEIPRNNFGEQGIKRLFQSLQHENCKVNALLLHNNNIGDAGITALSEAIQHPNCKLTQINLYRTNFSNAGALKLLSAIQHPNCKITSLNISGNNIDEEILQKITDQLQVNSSKANKSNRANQETKTNIETNTAPKKPSRIDQIQFHKVPEKYVKELQNLSAEKFDRFLEIYLDKQVKVEFAIKLIQHGLGLQNDILTFIDVNDPSQFRAELLLSVIEPQNNISSLTFSKSHLSISRTTALSHILQHPNCVIESLSLSFSQINNESLEPIIQILLRPQNLIKNLNLRFNEIGDEGAQRLLSAIRIENSKVISLDLGPTNISKEILRHLEEQIEKNNLRTKNSSNSEPVSSSRLVNLAERIEKTKIQNGKSNTNEPKGLKKIRKFYIGTETAAATIQEDEVGTETVVAMIQEDEVSDENIPIPTEQTNQIPKVLTAEEILQKFEGEFLQNCDDLGQYLNGLQNNIGEFEHQDGADEVSLEKAIAEFESALFLTQKIKPTTNSVLEDIYSNLANFHRIAGNLGDALVNYEKTIELKEKSSPETASLAVAYYQIAQVYHKLDLLSQALKFYGKSFEICKSKSLGNLTASMVKSLENKAIIFSKTGKMQKAIDSQLNVVNFHDNERSDALTVAKSRHILGSIFLANKNFDLALDNFKLELESLKDYPESIEHADCHRNIGNLLFQENLTESALTHYEESLRIQKELGKADDSQNINLYSNLSEIYRSKHEHDKARDCAIKCYDLLTSNKLEDLRFAKCCLIIGEMNRLEGQNQIALKYLLSGLEVADSQSNKSLLTAELSYNIGEIYLSEIDDGRSFNPEKALSSHTKAFKILRLKDPKGKLISDSFLSLGKIYEKRGEYGTAAAYLGNSIKINEQLTPPTDQQKISDIYFDLGLIRRSNEELELALDAFKKSLDIKKQISQKTLEVAQCYQNIADLEFEINSPLSNPEKINEIKTYLKKSLEIRKGHRIANNTTIYLSLSKIAELENNPSEVLANLSLAFQDSKRNGVKNIDDLAIRIAHLSFDQQEYNLTQQYLKFCTPSYETRLLAGKTHQKNNKAKDSCISFLSALEFLPNSEEAKILLRQSFEQICRDKFLDLSLPENLRFFTNIEQKMGDLPNKREILLQALTQENDPEIKANNLAILLNNNSFGSGISHSVISQIAIECQITKTGIPKLCQQIYPRDENKQISLFKSFVEKNAITINDIALIKDFAISLKEEGKCQSFIQNVGNPDIRLTKLDKAEIYGSRLYKKYPNLSQLLDIRISESFSPESISNLREELESDVSNLKVRDIFAYLVNGQRDLELVTTRITSSLTESCRQTLSNSLVPVKNSPYITLDEVGLLQYFTGNLLEKNFQKVGLITTYLRSRIPTIAPLTDDQISSYNFGRSNLFSSEQQQQNITTIFKSLLRDNQPQAQQISSFFEQTFNSPPIHSNHSNKITSFFKNNKWAIAHLFSRDEGIDNFIGIISALGDGCVANISTHFRIAFYQALITQPSDQILYSVLYEKISQKILNSGGDRLGSSATSDNIMNHSAINDSIISPQGLTTALQEEFYKKDSIIRDPRNFIVEEYRRQNSCHKNFEFLANISDVEAAKLAVKTVLESTLTSLVSNQHFNEFTNECRIIEERAKQNLRNSERNPSLVFNPLGFSKFGNNNLDNSTTRK